MNFNQLRAVSMQTMIGNNITLAYTEIKTNSLFQCITFKIISTQNFGNIIEYFDFLSEKGYKLSV